VDDGTVDDVAGRSESVAVWASDDPAIDESEDLEFLQPASAVHVVDGLLRPLADVDIQRGE